MYRTFIIFFSLLFAAVPLVAQDAILSTIGTTVEAASGKHYAYLLWQPGDENSTFGMRFAIYSKSGAPDDNSDQFSRLGIQTLQTSPHTIRAMFKLGETIDTAAAYLPERIDGLYRDTTFQSDSTPATPPDPSLDAAQKLSFLILSAADDPLLLGRLFFLGRAHPGVMMALGHAFCIEIPAGTVTYEVREIDSADSDVRVLGRTILNRATPLVLDAPSAPVQVPHEVKSGSQFPISNKDHLNVRLRWGVDTDLKEKLPHTFGFDVFRVKKDVAVGNGWHANPPEPVALLTAVDDESSNPDVGRVNLLPILISDLLTPNQAADASDKERVDTADDGVWFRALDGSQQRRPFTDGESFYYYVAARGITGRPGNVSYGTLVQMCDRVPPEPPRITSVRGITPTGKTTPHLEVKFRQVESDDIEETATGYYIYRWESSNSYLTNIGSPLVGRIGYVAHQPGEILGVYHDEGAGAPSLSTHSDIAVWYTIRPVGHTACAEETLGGHSGPVSGVLRDLEGPPAPDATFEVCHLEVELDFKSRSTAPPEKELPENYKGITIDVDRLSQEIVAADITIRLGENYTESTPLFSKRLFYQRSDNIRVTLPFHEGHSGGSLFLQVKAIAIDGTESEAWHHNTEKDSDEYSWYTLEADVTKQCVPVETVPGQPIHLGHNSNGSLNPIQGVIEIPSGQGVKEWRVYRRIGSNGELTLIAKNEGDLPSSEAWVDDSLPAVAANVCYYVQCFDQNSNPSPLSLVSCVQLVNPDLPTPMLEPAKPQEAQGNRAIATLNWFCDPAGVERFEILVAQSGGGIPDIGGVSAVDNAPIGGIPGTDPDLDFYPFQSPRVAVTGFGPGPLFSIDLEVPADALLYFVVRACGPGAYPRMAGSASNVATMRWQTPPTPGSTYIPWPARPMPPVTRMRRAINSYAIGEGPIWTIKNPYNQDYKSAPTSFLIGLAHGELILNEKDQRGTVINTDSPEEWLFRIRANNADPQSAGPLMPFILYRYQLPSTLYPNARPNLVQCTPLIDRISWVKQSSPSLRYIISDPYIHLKSFDSATPIPIDGVWDDDTQPDLGAPSSSPGDPRPPYLEGAVGMIVVDDPLPVSEGAKYQHILVRFSDDGEIDEVFRLEPVQH